MLNAGGLIKLHYHTNLDVLDFFSDSSGVLYYRGSPLFSNVQISEEEHNYLEKKEDGLFVDGTFIDRFSYLDNELYFDNKIVSREYTDQEITDMVNSLWVVNPYHTLGKIDLTYWFETVTDISTAKVYKNNSDTNMNIKINNPNTQNLVVKIDDTVTNDNSAVINVTLPSLSKLDIREANGNDINITVELIQG
jgi:hypothetical protein